MKKLVALSCFLVAFAAARPVQASTFTLGSVDVALRDFDPGLVLGASNLFAGDIVLNGVGASQIVNLFTISTTENALNLDDVVPFDIKVGLNFSQPAIGGAIGGITGAAWLLKSFGYVTWDDPIQLAFGADGAGLLQIALANAAFGLPGSANVKATFTLLRDSYTVPSHSTPEPGTLVLLAAGAGAMLFRRRRHA
jgi:hypothetical protein